MRFEATHNKNKIDIYDKEGGETQRA
ncbi:hypothetical protein [Neisseria cinerea]|nr:hypothetical protein [Neisseria cinerea]